MIIKWDFNGMDDSVAFFFVIDNHSSDSFFWRYLIMLFLIVIIIWFAILKYLPKIKSKDIEKHLTDNEKLVINALKNSDRNELWQKQIQLKTGLKKVKVSRLIRDLESRGLIEKIPFGNTNKIRLK